VEVLRAALINGDRSHSQAIKPTCGPPAPEVSSISALCSAPRPTTPLTLHPPDRRIRLRALLSSSHERLPPGADHGPRLRGGQVLVARTVPHRLVSRAGWSRFGAAGSRRECGRERRTNVGTPDRLPAGRSDLLVPGASVFDRGAWAAGAHGDAEGVLLSYVLLQTACSPPPSVRERLVSKPRQRGRQVTAR
jgi:hypothetical protein